MTETISISQILVDERQRKTNGDLTTLKESMHERGMLQPAGVQELNTSPDGKFIYRLLWGGRRLEAAKQLGWERIEAKVAPSMEDYEASELEFMENWERKSLTWQEECQAIGRIHRERVRKGALIGEKWGQRETARLLGNSVGNVNYTLKIATLLDAGDIQITEALNMAEALRIVLRRKEQETEVPNVPKTETYFKPEDMQKFTPQAPEVPIPQKDYRIYVWDGIKLENIGIIGTFIPEIHPRWTISPFLSHDCPETYDFFRIGFRNTALKEGTPFIPMLELFYFYWRREETPNMKDVIPIFTDNPSLERVLYGPEAMTDGWWDYIFEVVGRDYPVLIPDPSVNFDVLSYCLRKGIEVHLEDMIETELREIQEKFKSYGPIKIIYKA